MNNHSLWYIRREGHVVGPFAEALVCRYIVLGRISKEDELSQDSHFWRRLDELPELAAEVYQLIGLGREALIDPQWREERIKASLRWLDERVSLDRRNLESPAATAAWAPRRQVADRRAQQETAEQHAYRKSHAAFEAWLHEQHQRHGKKLILLAAVLLVILLAATIYRPVNPVKVGLFIPSADCNVPAAASINWAGCDKSGILLIGADLSGARLSRASFVGANLAYSNFSSALLEGADLKQADLQHATLRGAQLQGANLRGAKLEGADLAEAEFDNAIWIDGRTCKPGSKGQCH